jgi:hypothetical protein
LGKLGGGAVGFVGEVSEYFEIGIIH